MKKRVKARTPRCQEYDTLLKYANIKTKVILDRGGSWEGCPCLDLIAYFLFLFLFEICVGK